MEDFRKERIIMEVFKPEDINPEKLHEYDKWNYQLLIRKDTKEEFVQIKTDNVVFIIPLSILERVISEINLHKKEEETNG